MGINNFQITEQELSRSMNTANLFRPVPFIVLYSGIHCETKIPHTLYTCMKMCICVSVAHR